MSTSALKKKVEFSFFFFAFDVVTALQATLRQAARFYAHIHEIEHRLRVEAMHSTRHRA